MLRRLSILLVPLVLICSCQKGDQQVTKAGGDTPMSITVTSPAFQEGESIPQKYSCHGENVSPPLKWTSIPENTESIAVVLSDPDAPSGTFTHWIMFNIPPLTTNLPENTPKTQALKDGAEQGTNDAGKIGYYGPCPPSGTHRYQFRVYALDTTLSLEAGARVSELMSAMQGHILAQGMLTGKYSK